MKNSPEIQDSKKKRKPFKAARIILIVAAVIILLAVIILYIRMFGGVTLGTSDMDGTSRTSDISSPTSTRGGTSAAESTNAATTTSTTASANKPAATSASQTNGRPAATSGNSGDSGSYKPYIQPAGAEWNLKLVNKWNPLGQNFNPPLATYAGSNQFDSRAIDKLKALVAASNGRLRVASTYRSVQLQTKLYNDEVNKYIKQGKSRAEAEKIASQAVAVPGTSEHNLGLSVDFLFKGYSSLETSYKNTETYKWMMENCAKYGFILRYPEKKEYITGIMFEPWHYRYVGEEAAQEIMSRGITLEEYLQEKGK